ncbi:hypothetical protein C8Q74DRAFT_1361750 [Fomes fomentarius]|nr:hypothetical protein C8Q74DRAFT_1361750 [Fomes fomentarius]
MERPIYNGRPIHLEGPPITIHTPPFAPSPPITIYTPPFARIKEKVNNLDTVTLQQNAVNMLELTGLLFLAAGEIYGSKRERENAIYPLLCTLLDVSFYAREPMPGNEWTEIDGVHYVDVTALNPKARATGLYVELRNELDMKGVSGMQLARTYQRRISTDDHRDVRAVSCCPAIHMIVAGTDIRFYGAVLADVLIVQPLTDVLSLRGGPEVEERISYVAKVFQVIRDGYRDLSEWYRALRPTVASPYPVHVLPNPTLAPTAPPLPLPLSFLYRFDYPGRCRAGDASTIIQYFRCALFQAQFGKSEVLVKFCFRYCERAHRLLADHDPPLAPKLHACVRLLGGVTMVVMDIVPGYDNAATKYRHRELPAEVFGEVSMAVELLHDAGLVHGDLRRPNVMAVEREPGRMGAMLLDFNWAGEDGEVRYPALLNQRGQIDWADGVRPGRPIRMQHDKDMLAKLMYA